MEANVLLSSERARDYKTVCSSCLSVNSNLSLEPFENSFSVSMDDSADAHLINLFIKLNNSAKTIYTAFKFFWGLSRRELKHLEEILYS